MRGPPVAHLPGRGRSCPRSRRQQGPSTLERLSRACCSSQLDVAIAAQARPRAIQGVAGSSGVEALLQGVEPCPGVGLPVGPVADLLPGQHCEELAKRSPAHVPL